jgi:hypothetical protein
LSRAKNRIEAGEDTIYKKTLDYYQLTPAQEKILSDAEMKRRSK